jgi:hypothetical protein
VNEPSGGSGTADSGENDGGEAAGNAGGAVAE